MISESLDLKFYAYVVGKHAGQMRDEGVPYITHPIYVASTLIYYDYSRSYVLTGLGHDLIEDTDATFTEIVALTNSDVAYAINALSKKKGQSKDSYYTMVARNSIARPVKVADRLHNLLTMESGGWNKKRIRRYYDVSVKYILPLAKGTPIEPEFQAVLDSTLDRLVAD